MLLWRSEKLSPTLKELRLKLLLDGTQSLSNRNKQDFRVVDLGIEHWQHSPNFNDKNLNVSMHGDGDSKGRLIKLLSKLGWECLSFKRKSSRKFAAHAVQQYG